LPNGRRIIIVNVRLALPSLVSSLASLGSGIPLDYGYRSRMEQFPRLARLIQESQRRHKTQSVILAGDFNAPAHLPSLDPLRSMIQDVWPRKGVGWGGTMTAILPLSRIDQCWISPDIEIVSAQVRRTRRSDHRPLVVDLIVP
jgi:endonuclease/exonuclease/phosphatase (EEP) superfamily protein YafD